MKKLILLIATATVLTFTNSANAVECTVKGQKNGSTISFDLKKAICNLEEDKEVAKNKSKNRQRWVLKKGSSIGKEMGLGLTKETWLRDKPKLDKVKKDLEITDENAIKPGTTWCKIGSHYEYCD